MVLLTFVWKCFQDRNFHGVVVGLYGQSIESWVGLSNYRGAILDHKIDFRFTSLVGNKRLNTNWAIVGFNFKKLNKFYYAYLD